MADYGAMGSGPRDQVPLEPSIAEEESAPLLAARADKRADRVRVLDDQAPVAPNGPNDDDLENGQAAPRNTNPCEPFRLFVLVGICFLTFGSYWVFDTPGAIPSKLKEWFKGGHKSLSDAQNLAFYSVYSWPNTVLALFGGMIVDRVTGLRRGALMFCSFILIGQALFATGVVLRLYWLAVVGRFVFGLGGESLTVTQNSFTVKWFEGKYLALAFGTVVSFARVGSSINFLITPTLASIGVPFALFFGAGMCGVSFVMCCILCVLDRYAERNRPELTKPVEVSKEQLRLGDVMVQVRQIPAAAWVLNFICMFFYIGVLTFNTVASQIMQNTGKKYPEHTATLFLAIPNFVSVFASPLFGLLVDKAGRSLLWICIASTMMIVSMLVFLGNAQGWFFVNPIPLMVWQGTGYALGAASIWPSLSFVVPNTVCATAYGTMTSVQNVGMAVFPLVIGVLQGTKGIKDTKLQYTLPILIFVGCEIISFLLAFTLLTFDKRWTGGKLNGTHAQRKLIAERQQAAERQSLLEAEQREAMARVRSMNKAVDEQSRLLSRSVMTSRTAYYTRLGVGVRATRRPSVSYRGSFM